MVCGLCHREDTDHALSTSGPQRCKYLTHRENCPGGFRTKCDEHLLLNSETIRSEPASTFIDEKGDKLTAAMAALDLDIKKDDGAPPTTFNLDGLLPQQIQQLAQLGLQLLKIYLQNRVGRKLLLLQPQEGCFFPQPLGQHQEVSLVIETWKQV